MSASADFYTSIERDDFFLYPEFEEQILPSIGYSQIQKDELRNSEPRTPQVADYLVAFSTNSRSYCVGMVDMVNSTKTAARLGSSKAAKYYQIFLNSMSKILSGFEGTVIKNVGDCLLFYFPDSNKNKYDFHDPIDCCITMVNTRKILCSKLKEENLPELDYRISLDYGTIIEMKANDSTKIDMIGPPINMCSKINRLSCKNGIVLGGDMYEVVKKLDYRFKSISNYSLGFKQSYPVYSVEKK